MLAYSFDNMLGGKASEFRFTGVFPIIFSLIEHMNWIVNANREDIEW